MAERTKSLRGDGAGGPGGAASADVTRRIDPAERREQVIARATLIIARHGYWGFSVRQVAEACGLTEPAVIYHFKNKVGLLTAVLEHRDCEDMSRFAHQLGVEVDDVWEGKVWFGLRDICDALVRRNAGQPEIVRLYTVLQGEALEPHHPAYEYYRNRERRVLRILARAADHDGIVEPEREARVVLSMMDGIQLRWLHDPEHVDLIREWAAFADDRWR